MKRLVREPRCLAGASPASLAAPMSDARPSVFPDPSELSQATTPSVASFGHQESVANLWMVAGRPV